MEERCMKNYLIGLKYFFTPLGTMFLGMMIGFSVLLPGVTGALSALSEGLRALTARVELDLGVLFDTFWGAVRALDWNAPVDALKTMFSGDWFRASLTEALRSILGTDFETFRLQIAALLDAFTGALFSHLAAFFVLWLFGFVAGFWLVRFQIRRNIARRTLWKWLLTSLLNSVFTAAFSVVAVFCLAIWKWSIAISAFLLVVLVCVTALSEAYLVYGRGKVPFKSVVNPENTRMYALTSLLIFAISVALTLIACLVNRLMGLFVGLSLLEIAVIVVGLNAESYVMSLCGETPVRKARSSPAEPQKNREFIQ